MSSIMRFFKSWSLAVGMGLGVVVYFLFHELSILSPLKPGANALSESLMPVCVFLMLFFTFCKVNPRDLCFRRWYVWLLLGQVGGCGLTVLVMTLFPHLPHKVLWEAAMLTLICPTAAAAPVICGKLGGNEATITTYTLLSNLAAAVSIPLFFPLVESSGTDVPFLLQVWAICRRVFPLLVFPLLLAWLLLWLTPRVHAWIVRWFHGAPFYIWSFNLILLTGQALRGVFNSPESNALLIALSVLGLVLCIVQFSFGRWVGTRVGERIDCGQAFGQKNNVFAVWVASAYLPLVVTLTPSSYILWQNIFNTWELRQKAKADARKPSPARASQ